MTNKENIQEINIKQTSNELAQFIDMFVISQKAKLIMNKCHQLNKNSKKIINLYDQITKLQTASRLTSYFLNKYNIAFKTHSDQNKIEKAIKDKLDLPRIRI